MTTFKDRQQTKVYDLMRATPPVARTDGSFGGCTLSSAYWAGRRGVGGVHRGVNSSLQRAAWTAGRDAGKAEGK